MVCCSNQAYVQDSLAGCKIHCCQTLPRSTYGWYILSRLFIPLELKHYSSTCDLEYHYAEAIVPKPRIVTTSRLGKDMFRGGNWYEPIRKSPECTDWAEDEGRPSILTSEHLIEDELEAFKVIHIRTMPGLGHPENENTTGRTESYWGFSDLQITPPPIPPVGQHIYPTVPEYLIGSFLDSTLQLTNIIRKDCSVVYSAVNVHTSQVYTVKAYNKYGTGGRPLDERQREALSREFQLHYAVSAHPKIVSLLKIIEDVDCLYAVLEHCPEEDLFSHIVEKEKYIGDDAAIRAAFLQITDAVEHCHRLGMYHRDLRPENFLVRDSTLLLGNFAHATTDEKSVPATNESTFYMSPGKSGLRFYWLLLIFRSVRMLPRFQCLSTYKVICLRHLGPWNYTHQPNVWPKSMEASFS